MGRGRKTHVEEDEQDDQTLGAKIRHLIGICGYRFGHQHTQDNRIARYIDVDPATWARMKSGKQTVDSARLGRLTEYFRLDSDYQLTYKVFMCPTLGAFDTALREARVGAYGAGGMDAIRAKLTAARNVRANGIGIERSNATRAGGLGPAGVQAEPLFLRPGDTVTLRIAHPEGGHMLLLNDGPDNEIVCLMPSQLAPRTDVRGRVTRVPTDESPSPNFAVNAPAGRYRLYAVWTRKPLSFDFVKEALAIDEKFLTVPASGLRQLAALIEGFDNASNYSTENPAYEIRIADYNVTSAYDDRAARPL